MNHWLALVLKMTIFVQMMLIWIQHVTGNVSLKNKIMIEIPDFRKIENYIMCDASSTIYILSQSINENYFHKGNFIYKMTKISVHDVQNIMYELCLVQLC